MKKKIILVGVLLLFMGHIGFAQTYKNALKISPFQFGRSYLELSYERYLGTGKTSFQISPMVLLKQVNDQEFKGVQLELQYRVYLKQLNESTNKTWFFSDVDFYAGLYGLGLTYTENNTQIYWDPDLLEEVNDVFKKDIQAAEAGVFVGMGLTIVERIVIDFTAGGGVRYSEVEDQFRDLNIPSYYYQEGGVFSLGHYGVKPKFNLQLGITL